MSSPMPLLNASRRDRTAGLYSRLRAPVIIWIAIVFHACVGVALIFSSEAGASTGPDAVVVVLGNHVIAGAVMTAAAALALTGVLRQSRNPAYLFGQQMLLLVAAVGVLLAIGEGQFADGTERPSTFIFTDQLPTLLIAFAHGIVTWTWLIGLDSATD